jgi:hypothetical protein
MGYTRKIKMILKKSVPAPILRFVLFAYMSIRLPFVKLKYFGRKHYCPICQSWVRIFLPFGDPPRDNARCPICGSLERHRLNWLFLQKKTNLFDKSLKRMLHIAPEICFISRLKSFKNLDYISADLDNPIAMMKFDITNIPFEDNTFNVIYCCHVLEHVQDDQKAIEEFYRVLKPGGWAVLQVPISIDKTFEDPTIISPDERKKYFGHIDHVRRCGPDYLLRMKKVGFETTRFDVVDIIKEKDISNLMRIGSDQMIFFCRKLPLREEIL